MAQFSGLFAGGFGVDTLGVVAKHYGLIPHKLVEQGAVEFGRLGAPAVVAGAVLKATCHQGVGLLTIDLAGEAHAIGFRVMGGTYRFFDPNFGSYATPQRDTFNTALQGLLETKYSTLQSYKIYQFTIRPMTGDGSRDGCPMALAVEDANPDGFASPTSEEVGHPSGARIRSTPT